MWLLLYLRKTWFLLRQIILQILQHFLICLKVANEAAPIPGLRLVGYSKLHWLERIFWLVLYFGALSGSIFTCIYQMNRFIANPTVIVIDRDFRNWNETLPSLTLCYDTRVDPEIANSYIEETWNLTLGDDDYLYFLDFITVLANSTANDLNAFTKFENDERLSNIDLMELTKIVHPQGAHIVSKLGISGDIDINQVMTERGLCYTINSRVSPMLMSRKPNLENLIIPKSCRYNQIQCAFKLEVFEEKATIEIHSPYEPPVYEASVYKIRKSDEMIGIYRVLHTEAGDSLRELSVNQRKCVFPDESINSLPMYSVNLCLMKCRAESALEICSCKPHFYPFMDGEECDPDGLVCLHKFSWPKWDLKVCDCPSMCTDLKYSEHSIKSRVWALDEEIPFLTKATFRWEIEHPKFRLTRDIVFSFEDLIVSIGGSIGFFLGFSFFSSFAIMYALFRFWLKKIKDAFSY